MPFLFDFDAKFFVYTLLSYAVWLVCALFGRRHFPQPQAKVALIISSLAWTGAGLFVAGIFF